MIEAYLEKMSKIDYSGQLLSSLLQSWLLCLCSILFFNLFLFFTFFFLKTIHMSSMNNNATQV